MQRKLTLKWKYLMAFISVILIVRHFVDFSKKTKDKDLKYHEKRQYSRCQRGSCRYSTATEHRPEIKVKRYLEHLQIHCPVTEYIGGFRNGWNLCKTKPEVDRTCSVLLISPNISNNKFVYEVEAFWKCKVKAIRKRELLFGITHHNSSGQGHLEEIKNMDQIDILVLDRSPKDVGHIDIVKLLLEHGVLDRVKQFHFSITLIGTKHKNDRKHNMKNSSRNKKYKTEVQQNLADQLDSKNLKEVNPQTLLNLLDDLYTSGFRIYTRDIERGTDVYTISRYGISMIKDIPVMEALVPPTTIQLSNMTISEATQMYHEYIVSTQILCEDIIRVGNVDDGGWEVCNDEPYRPRKGQCLVYSFGISNDWTFDDTVTKMFGCKDYAFDPSIGLSDHDRSDSITFHKLGLSGNNTTNAKGWRMMTLDSIRRMLKHTDKPIDVLKMDIEDSEWLALPQMLASNSIFGIRQLYMEFHIAANGVDKRFLNAMKLLRKLYDIGFRIYWSHPNEVPSQILYSRERRREVAANFEVYFINVNSN